MIIWRGGECSGTEHCTLNYDIIYKICVTSLLYHEWSCDWLGLVENILKEWEVCFSPYIELRLQWPV